MIFLGSGTFTAQGNTFVIAPPTGTNLGAVNAVRLSNYTGDALELTNITGQGAQQEYLLPYQQMVYLTENGWQAPPTMTGLVVGANLNPNKLLVEWSTEPSKDFPGTYPVDLAVLPSLTGTENLAGQVLVPVVGSGAITFTPPPGTESYVLRVKSGQDPVFIGSTTSTPDFPLASTDAPLTIPNGAPIGILDNGTAGSLVFWLAFVNA